MMPILAALFGEKAKKEKHIAYAKALFREVRLGSASLAKSASAFVKHRVFMTEVFRAQSPVRRLRHNVAESGQLVG
jgi:hypothetical protein